MKRNTLIRTAILILITLVVISGSTYALGILSNEDGLASLESETEIQTATARQGDLLVLASGSGELAALDETTLKFGEHGMLAEVLVSVGEQVTAGDVLARLHTNKTESQFAANIARAELSVVENQQALDELYAEAELNAAQALFNLEVAQKELADLLNNDVEVAKAKQAVVEAEEAMDDAEMILYIHNSSPSDEDIYSAYATLLFKEKALNELKDEVADLEYEHKTARNKDARMRVQDQLDRTLAQMYNAQMAYEAALYRYETIDDPADALDVNLAQAQMNTAQAQLDQAELDLSEAQLGACAGDLALAESEVAEAKTEWYRWQDGPDPQDVLLAETRLDASQLDLQLAMQESLYVDLTAPIDGTVMEIHAAVNQNIEGHKIITLADTSQPLIEVYLDEADFQNAQVGNRVEVIFEAMPDQKFTGSLVEITPGLERVSNTQVIQGLAVLDQRGTSLPLIMPVGLNASVDVIAGEANNAVLVPIEALWESSPGNYSVYVQVDNGYEPREVTVGLMDFTLAEIVDGLENGDVVAISNLDLE